MTHPPPRDHGGGLDAAIAQFGGARNDWIDLSTGINPDSYPVPDMPDTVWHDLPDKGAVDTLVRAARTFWSVPDAADILPSAGVSQLIACAPGLADGSGVVIDHPTYNEHAAAFKNFGHVVGRTGHSRVIVHPNNPDGRLAKTTDFDADFGLTIIDESFCDTCPEQSLISKSADPGTLILKGLGKFWGLAGLRLGFAIGEPRLIQKLRDQIGPWAASGPALHIGARALSDIDWAKAARKKLHHTAGQLDTLMQGAGHSLVGGTDLFRLYAVPDAETFRTQLAQKLIWSRIFPYSKTWVRLGLPKTGQEMARLNDAIGTVL